MPSCTLMTAEDEPARAATAWEAASKAEQILVADPGWVLEPKQAYLEQYPHQCAAIVHVPGLHEFNARLLQAPWHKRMLSR